MHFLEVDKAGKMIFVRGLICFGLLVFVGCGNDRPPLASLTGTVTLDGKPVQYAGLMFSPIDGGRPSVAGTDENGEFKAIYVYGVPGAIIGKHRVMFEEGSPDSGPESEEDEFKPYAPPATNYTISPKEIDVDSRGTLINFTLERKERKKKK